jgi:hypothetical protein
MANTAYSALPCWQYARVCLTIFVNLYLDNLTLRNRQRRHMRNRYAALTETLLKHETL